ncbi:hypothetical protein NPIL_82241 [Nephila pilipes]|uniref:Uncharacterized protein n=1 Tax=Nephila pilipes TaxID=299642 RepID=A0A8X6R042_NEPPI|nr:hypothetical protein NPIL_82241 [Nephila pilipes]
MRQDVRSYDKGHPNRKMSPNIFLLEIRTCSEAWKKMTSQSAFLWTVPTAAIFMWSSAYKIEHSVGTQVTTPQSPEDQFLPLVRDDRALKTQVRKVLTLCVIYAFHD